MNCLLLFYFSKLNNKTNENSWLCSHSSYWVKILKDILQEIEGLYWKLYLLFISCYFLKQLTYTLDTKTWKNLFSSYKSKKNIWMWWELKYYQLTVKSEIGILLEIILNAFKCLTVSLSTETFVLAMVQLLWISVSILCELAMLPDVYILLFPQEEEGTVVQIWKYIHQKDWILYLPSY